MVQSPNFFCIVTIICCFSNVRAILPTAAIDVACLNGGCKYILLSSQASFGTWPEMSSENNEPMIPMLPPDDNSLLCMDSNHIMSNEIEEGKKFVLVVPRGECSFERKAIAAQKLGASGLIIYGTLASRYSLNTTTNQIIYPQEFNDFDCSMAEADIPISSISLDKPYDDVHNDPILSGSSATGNLCAAQNQNYDTSCPSRRCLLTGNFTSDGEFMRACCAWDLHVWLYKDDTLNVSSSDISIPTLYITMAESDVLLRDMKANQIQIVMYRRYYPKYNLASVIIWALGVIVAASASWLSASEYRNYKVVTSISRDCNQADPSRHGYHRVGSSGGPSSGTLSEESVELEASHACGFIIFASFGLLVLFFFKIYKFVKVMYAFGCSGALAQVLVYPAIIRLGRLFRFHDRILFTTSYLDNGDVTVLQLLSALVCYTLGAIWLYMALTVLHPDDHVFFWVLQDIFGACMCVVFLSTMRLNSMKVASVLLTAAFLYDIFFVFVTPYLTKGGKSIMVDVATSGGPPKGDPSWCEKYPHHDDCTGGDPLPMLFTIPRLFDYAGGSSMLGLGDIVLPGLLISFAARYDEAKRFIGSLNRDRINENGLELVNHSFSTRRKGYFYYMVIAYAVGLAMANIAVYAMNMGQPALLYLVPCCLGTMMYLSKRRGEDMWNTPNVIAACEDVLYGESADDKEEEGTNSREILPAVT